MYEHVPSLHVITLATCMYMYIHTVGSQLSEHASQPNAICDATPIIEIATWFSWLWYKTNFKGAAIAKGHTEECAAGTHTIVHKGGEVLHTTNSSECLGMS